MDAIISSVVAIFKGILLLLLLSSLLSFCLSVFLSSLLRVCVCVCGSTYFWQQMPIAFGLS